MIARHEPPCIDHPFQDALYGKGYRVMNPVHKDGEVIGARCTVCCPPKLPNIKRGGVFALNDLIRRA